MTCHINLGSNLGDRAAHIERAVAAIERATGCPARRSGFIESEPWGFDSPNRFLNLGIAIDTDMPPHELLHTLQAVERSINPASHRDARGSYIDRAIDIDLIAVGEMVVETPELTLPHPRMHLREFVLEPMRQLDPAWTHPLLGKLW